MKVNVKSEKSENFRRKDNFYLQNRKIWQACICWFLTCFVTMPRSRDHTVRETHWTSQVRALTGECFMEINLAISKANKKFLLPLTMLIALIKTRPKEIIKDV